jgi:response regulator of citrate/malate metabolism
MPRFNLVAATSHPNLAARVFQETEPDLVIIDAGLEDGVGIRLARHLRWSAHTPEIITVGDATLDFVRASCHLGAVDIVTLPARGDRFREASEKFIKHMAALSAMQSGGPLPSMRSGGRWLPKGISRENVDLVRRVLSAEGPATSSEIGTTVGLARVTCRRYLEYLVTIGEATAVSVATGPGRPRRVYEQLPDRRSVAKARQVPALA